MEILGLIFRSSSRWLGYGWMVGLVMAGVGQAAALAQAIPRRSAPAQPAPTQPSLIPSLTQPSLIQPAPTPAAPTPAAPTQPTPTQTAPDLTTPTPALPARSAPTQPSLVPTRSIQSGGSSIFENVTLSPSFAPDPLTVRGISGGEVLAAEVAGRTETSTGDCIGFVDRQPDHTIELTQFFNFLSLQVQSSADTSLIVRGPGGTWCNDDYTDKNPGIAGQWLSGTYEIWIGSYDSNAYHPYVIRITEQR